MPGPLLYRDFGPKHRISGKGPMAIHERKKELNRRRKRKAERFREKMKALRSQWEKKKQDKREERIVIKKAVTKSTPPEEQA
jgi:hypothetical protein